MARVRDSRGRYTKRRRTTARRRKPATRARRRTYRRNPGVAELMLMNPPKKRRGGKRRARSRARRVYGRARRYASKSLIPSVSGIMGTVQEGAFLAAGAVIVSQVYARFVPESLKTGPVKHLVRLGVAVVGGNLMGRFVSPRIGRAVTVGGVMSTVLIAANEYLGGAIAPLGGLEEMALGAYYAEPPALSAYYSPGMISAQPDFLGGMGWEGDIPERLSPGNRF